MPKAPQSYESNRFFGRPLVLRENYQRFISRTARARTDWIGPFCLLVLATTGVFFIYSAQRLAGSPFWLKQIVWIGVGAGIYTTVARIDYQAWLRHGHWVYIASLVLLGLLWSPLGLINEGSRRWLSIPGFSFQPSESAKIGALIMVSSVLARSDVGTLRQSMWVLFKVFLAAGIPIILILLQPDLGSALVFAPMILSLLFVSRLSPRFFIVVTALFVGALGVVGADMYRYHQFLKENDYDALKVRGQYEKTSWLPLYDYQRERIMSFVAPEAVDPRGIGASWNYRQSKQAVGTGGPYGKGYTQGDQAQLGYLPRSVAHNDFIFAVLAEEMGFVGAALVTGIFVVLTANTLRIAGRARDRFGLYLATGVSVIFMVHIFVNIGMTIGMMPITGLPLPFVSYGGSFMLSCCILQGLVQSVFRHRREVAR